MGWYVPKAIGQLQLRKRAVAEPLSRTLLKRHGKRHFCLHKPDVCQNKLTWRKEEKNFIWMTTN